MTCTATDHAHDFVGNGISPGATVLWGVGGRRTQGLRRGVVTEVWLERDRWWVRVKGDLSTPGGIKLARQVCLYRDDL